MCQNIGICAVDLSRFRAAPCARLSHFAFECDRAFPTQSWVPPVRIVEAIDVILADTNYFSSDGVCNVSQWNLYRSSRAYK